MHKICKLALSILAVAGLLAAMCLFPASAETSFTDAKNYVNVRSFGAKGDGMTNDTEAVQKAVNAAKSGGKTVFFPAGLYNINSSITVPAGVNIEGVTSAANGPWQNLYDGEAKGQKYNGLSSGNYWDAKLYAGSWIFVADGSGNVDAGGTFRLEGNNTVSRLGFVNLMCPPIYEVESTPTAPVIAVDINKLTSTKGIVIEDISLTNPYYGIAVYQDSLKNDNTNKKLSGKNSGPITIRNIMGAAMYRGISVIGANGKVLIDNIQFNYATYGSPYITQHASKCVDIEIAASTDVTIRDYLSFGAYTGLRTFSAFSGSPVNLNAISLNLEGVMPLMLEASGNQTVRNSYILITNFAGAANTSTYRSVVIKQDKNSSVKPVYTLDNIIFQSPGVVDHHLYDITLQGGATVNVGSNLVWDFSTSQPIINYVHESGASSKVTFTSLAFCTNKNGGKLAAVSGSAYQSGELTFRYCRVPVGVLGKLANADSNIKFENCTKGYGSSSAKFSN